jgi:hypothetical protein
LSKLNKAIWLRKLNGVLKVCYTFREPAMIIARSPTSEAAAERLFSIL